MTFFHSIFYFNFRIIIACIGVVFLLSQDFHTFSEVTINQRPFIIEQAEKLYWINKLNVPFTNRSIVEKTPTEVRHIGFLKVHKAGSTTVQNMLFRFGLKRNLTFVIPRIGNYFDVYSTLPVKEGGHYDILAVHTNGFNKADFDQILPPDKVNIAIVREPLTRMISGAYYYRDEHSMSYLLSIPKDNFIRELVSNPEKYEPGVFSFTKNSMGRDFGFDSNTHESDIDEILQKLRFLEKEFLLVLVMERFEESLVLLKRYLGWHISDILFIPSNAYEHASANLSEEQKLKHKHTCFLDYAIYDFFSAIFDYKVNAEGPEFQEEVNNFRDIIQQIKEFCTHPNALAEEMIVKASKWNQVFRVSRSDCEFMLLHELKFIERLRKRHILMNG